METVNIQLKKIEPNRGQIEGLPKNPRFIKDVSFRALVKSIKENPEMLEMRELLVYPKGTKFIIIGGNMRYRAMRELGYETAPCKVIPESTTPEQLRAYTIKDNGGFGEWDFDMLTSDWNPSELTDWGVELPDIEMKEHIEETEEQELERKKKEFEERMASGELSEDDEEYQEFLQKFEAKKTTDDCYTPSIVYDAVADWVSKEYGVSRAKFKRPFYPGGDYQKEDYKPDEIVVDNPPFSIMAEILNFYDRNGIRFFLFGPHLTLFSSSSSTCTTLPVGVTVTYANGANVATSFLTNLAPQNIRFMSAPVLYQAVKTANDENLKTMRKELPKYSYDHHIITSPMVSLFSKYGIDFVVSVDESEPISRLDSQKDSGKAIFGKGYIVSDRVFAEREKAEREKAEREKAEREKAEREKAEREKPERWELSAREYAIIKKLNAHGKETD